ncbi:MAG: GntR family transcriptional regulator [Acidobacteriota bacterium]
MEKGTLNLKSLKEQVYEYLREEIHSRRVMPGSAINMDATSRKLGISKTPLRDALIQLEMEGFVTILPRKGIFVNSLAIEDIKNIYQIIGSLESSALASFYKTKKDSDLDRMEILNNKMEQALKKNDFNLFYKYNLDYHNVFLNKSNNPELIKLVNILKKRLYDFPLQEKWIKEWEEESIICHRKIVSLLKKGNIKEASLEISENHWSFKVQEKYIRKYYFNDK